MYALFIRAKGMLLGWYKYVWEAMIVRLYVYLCVMIWDTQSVFLLFFSLILFLACIHLLGISEYLVFSWPGRPYMIYRHTDTILSHNYCSQEPIDRARHVICTFLPSLAWNQQGTNSSFPRHLQLVSGPDSGMYMLHDERVNKFMHAILDAPEDGVPSCNGGRQVLQPRESKILN